MSRFLCWLLGHTWQTAPRSYDAYDGRRFFLVCNRCYREQFQAAIAREAAR